MGIKDETPEKEDIFEQNDKGRENKLKMEKYLLSAYRQILLSVFFSILIISTFLLFTFWNSISGKGGAEDSLSPMLVSVMAGSLGSVFSLTIRVYNFENLPKAVTENDLEKLGNKHLIVYSLIPVLVGAVSAAFIYVIFSSQIISGSIFPKFICKANGIANEVTKACPKFHDLVDNWGPEQALDYAKVIVWGFIAGFAERLVPNTIDKLSESVKVSSK